MSPNLRIPFMSPNSWLRQQYKKLTLTHESGHELKHELWHELYLAVWLQKIMRTVRLKSPFDFYKDFGWDVESWVFRRTIKTPKAIKKRVIRAHFLLRFFVCDFYLQLKSLPKYAPVRRFDGGFYWRIVASLLKIQTIILTKILTGQFEKFLTFHFSGGAERVFN